MLHLSLYPWGSFGSFVQFLWWESLFPWLDRWFCCCCVFLRLFVVITFSLPFLRRNIILCCCCCRVVLFSGVGVFASPAPPFLDWDPMLCCCCARCWQRWLALSQQRVFTVTVGRKHQSHRAGASPPPPPPPPVFFPPDTPGTQPGSNHCEVLLPECSAVFCSCSNIIFFCHVSVWFVWISLISCVPLEELKFQACWTNPKIMLLAVKMSDEYMLCFGCVYV